MTASGINDSALYVTFRLEEEVFALDVAQVQEVLDMNPITKVPRAPSFMRGVINVRGSVVPVVDLRTKFGLISSDVTVDTRIIIIRADLDGKSTVLGAIADSVNDVVEMEPGQIEPPPALGDGWRPEFIRGIGKKNDKFIVILDVNQVFSSEDIITLRNASEDSTDDYNDTGTAKDLTASKQNSFEESAMDSSSPNVQ